MATETRSDDTAESEADRRGENRRWKATAFVLAGLLVIVLIVFGYGGIKTANDLQDANDELARANTKLTQVEAEDRERLARAAYRLCSRVNGVHAFGHVAATDAPGLRELVVKTLPILDCSPNLVGRQAAPLPFDRQMTFVAYYRTTKTVPLTCDGFWIGGTNIYKTPLGREEALACGKVGP